MFTGIIGRERFRSRGQMFQDGIIQIPLGSASKRPDVSQQAGEASASAPPPSYLLQ